jgi:hypothetical protein
LDSRRPCYSPRRCRANGKTLRSIDVAAHAGTAFDGQHLYQLAEDRIQKIDPNTGRVLATIPAPGRGGDSGLAWAEGTLWVGQYRDRRIHQIDPQTGTILRTIESKNGRGSGESRDAARSGHFGTRVRWRRSVLLRRRQQRQGENRAPEETLKIQWSG